MADPGKIAVPRGTQDVLPGSWQLRQHVIDTARAAFERTGFGRIATPTFEETALFARGVGESTDIVSKEMYTFSDRSDRSLTLRPEGTAPVVRAFISHGMHRDPLPAKLWYYAPMFRYEAPQKGRYREHYQLGCEVIGSPHAAVDAELVALLHGVYRTLGVPQVGLRLNSIGDANCRPAYFTLLVAFLKQHEEELCTECRARMTTNPLRTLDCKNPTCRAVLADAPRSFEHLCDACQEHFDLLRALLDAAGVAYEIDGSLVRGIDYYTRTTFEFTSGGLGSQDALGGGGRYDGLAELLGGPPTPAVGFGAGIERIVLALESAGVEAPSRGVDVYAVVLDEQRRPALFSTIRQLRDAGYVVEQDLMQRSSKGQFKQATRLGAKLVLVGDADGFRLQDTRTRDERPIDQPGALDTIRAALDLP